MDVRKLRLAAGALAVVFALAMAFALPAPLGGGPALAAATTLTISAGTATVTHADGATETAVDGQVLVEGDTIRTASASRATITYFEGSTVTIESDSSLTVERAAGTADGDTVIVMSQHLGRTWHVVVSLLTGSSRYEVKTPASTASVRGTVFEVRVTSELGATAATVTTTEGLVVHSAPDPADPTRTVEVPVAAGATHKVTKGERAAPALRVVDGRPAPRVTVTSGARPEARPAGDAKVTAKPKPVTTPRRAPQAPAKATPKPKAEIVDVKTVVARQTALPRPENDERKRDRR